MGEAGLAREVAMMNFNAFYFTLSEVGFFHEGDCLSISKNNIAFWWFFAIKQWTISFYNAGKQQN